ncbi:nucleotidyltransferase family protein [Treponema denticola]|uniref:nucleotidyltransferase family protein n=1 Tax=Treponema denticola TaxID=158 RepID=UPI0021069150|nr:nucleotidyltransferase domain-containing protein [Treponema denticola]UTY25852.1 nucleotidyltransferase domain-containing protein [Treponema denticola]
MKFGLTEAQEKILADILQKYIKSGEGVVLGSRAMGTNTERSDIDIALKNVKFFSPYALGDLIDEIAESDFPYLADVIIYEDITNPALKEHIDRVGERLVT